MKNIMKISLLGVLWLFAQTSFAMSDTLKIMKNDGEIIKVVVEANNLDEVKSFNLQKMISSFSDNEEQEIIMEGDQSNYQLTESEGLYRITEIQRKNPSAQQRFVFKIYENTSESEIERLVEKAEDKGFDVTIKNLQIINGEIKAITMSVDCNDGYSGTASTANIPESGFGFVRSYNKDKDAPFILGNVFGSVETDMENEVAENDTEYSFEFNKEKSIQENKKLVRYEHDIDFSIGLNGYVMPNGRFPEYSNEDYSLHQITSWTYQIHSSNQIKVGNYFKLNTRAGFRWNNFALSNENLQFFKGANELEFINRTDVEGKRSKLNVTYINLEAIPIFKFGKSSDAFRIGAGVYGGYRLGSKSKFKYQDDGKDVDKNNFYLNNWNYGVKAQIGWQGLDIFASYDLSPLFIENAGPELNTFTFGIVL